MAKQLKKTVTVSNVEATQIYEKMLSSWGAFAEKSPEWAQKCLITSDSTLNMIYLKSPWAELSFSCKKGCVEIVGELAWLAIPFQGQVDSMISKWIHSNFPETHK